jgi:hypothetical protein
MGVPYVDDDEGARFVKIYLSVRTWPKKATLVQCMVPGGSVKLGGQSTCPKRGNQLSTGGSRRVAGPLYTSGSGNRRIKSRHGTRDRGSV